MDDFPVLAGIFLLIMLVSFVSWLLFARTTMARIEKQLAREGIKTAQWDGIGVRAIWYAWAILFHDTILDQKDDILIDNPAVNRHANRKDRILASVLIISTGILGIAGFIHYFFPFTGTS